MRRLAASALSSVRWSFFQDVVRYSLIGYESIGLWRHKLAEYDCAEVADTLHEMKMSVSSISWAGGFTGNDGLTFKEAIDDAIEAIQLAGIVGSQCLILHPGSRNGHTKNHSQRLLCSALDELIPVASDYDVRIAIEPVFPKTHREWTIFDDIRDAVNLVTCYSPAQLGLVFDLFHVGTDKRVFDNLSHLLPWVSLIQVADCALVGGYPYRCEPGSGDVPLNDWLFALHQHGYRGQFELEVHSTHAVCQDYFEMLTRSHDFMTDALSQILNRSKAPTGKLTGE